VRRVVVVAPPTPGEPPAAPGGRDTAGDRDGDDEPIARSISALALRARGDLVAAVRSVGPAPGPTVALDVVLDDGTGTLLCYFAGRTALPGVTEGRLLWVAGRLVTFRSRRCLLNPVYGFVDAGAATGDSS
jgi:hypothetical protein